MTSSDLSFESWWSARNAAMLRFAYALTAGDAHRAEDILQSAVAHVWRKWGQLLARQVDLDTYMRKAIANEHLAFWRLKRNHELPQESTNDQAVASTTDRVDDVDLVWRALSGLPRRHQVVLALRFVDDMSDAQIATMLGISESAVRSYSARGIAAIRARTTTPKPHAHASRPKENP